MKRLAVTQAVAATILAASVGGVASPAAAAATVIRGGDTSQVTEYGITDDCRPGTTGTLHGTDVMRFQSVETAQGFHVRITEGGPGRIDWTDGSFTLIDSVDRLEFNAAAHGTTNLTTTHTDSGDFYLADGTFQLRVTFHEVEHFTVTNGVVRVDHSKGHFHFFGSC